MAGLYLGISAYTYEEWKGGGTDCFVYCCHKDVPWPWQWADRLLELAGGGIVKGA